MKVKILTIQLTILLSYLNLIGQEYIWPTDASRYLTSSFAEYRPGHFHAGIDIKTWNREGYKVFAIRDGYIFRISVSPFGYGKVLYQKLDTGEIAVYAHLKKFNEKIERIVKNEQKRVGEYRINRYFGMNDIPVSQGEVIAYTGSTGIGHPHLHFEMRNKNNHPTNPFLLGYKIDDTALPRISNISITPLDSKSRVNSDVKPVIIRPQLIAQGYYKINEQILLSGNVGFAVECYDQTEDVNNKYAVYGVSLYIDNVLKFEAMYDKFSYDVSHLIDLDRDYRLNSRGLGLFQKLYKEKENILPFYRPIGENIGIIYCNTSGKDISDNGSIYNRGTHDFRIELYDYNDNLTILEGEFLVGEKRQLFSIMENDEEGNFYLTDIYDETGSFVSNPQISLSSNHGASWNVHRLTPITALDRLIIDQNRYLVNTISPITIMKIIAEDEFGLATFPSFSLLLKNLPSPGPTIHIHLDKDFYDDYLRLQIIVDGLIKDVPRLFVQQIGNPSTAVNLIQDDFNSYFGVYQFIPGGEGSVEIKAIVYDLTGKELIFWDQFDINTITPQQGGKAVSKDGNCQIYFNPNSVYRNLFLRISEALDPDTNKYDFVGYAYRIEPFDVPLKNKATVYLKYPVDDPLPGKLGIYGSSNNKKWNFLGNRLNSENSIMSTRLSSLRIITLVRDTIPPEITIYSPQQMTVLPHKNLTIKVFVKDLLSGIASERSIIAKLDGKKVIAEYDPEKHLITYEVEEPLSIGKHELFVWAIDNCGNENSKKSIFTIVRGQ